MTSTVLVPSVRRRVPARLACLVAIASLALSASPVGAATATPYGTNLVKNPGAQDGLNDWDTFANMRVVRYGTSGFPTTNQSAKYGGGTKFFSAGPYSDVYGQCGDAQQTITLRGRGSAIDAGQVRVTFAGRVGAAGAVTAHFDLYFRNAENHSVAVNGLTTSVSGTGRTLPAVQRSRTLPRNTRLLRVHLWADGIESGYCKAWFDKVKVVISKVS